MLSSAACNLAACVGDDNACASGVTSTWIVNTACSCPATGRNVCRSVRHPRPRADVVSGDVGRPSWRLEPCRMRIERRARRDRPHEALPAVARRDQSHQVIARREQHGVVGNRRVDFGEVTADLGLGRPMRRQERRSTQCGRCVRRAPRNPRRKRAKAGRRVASRASGRTGIDPLRRRLRALHATRHRASRRCAPSSPVAVRARHRRSTGKPWRARRWRAGTRQTTPVVVEAGHGEQCLAGVRLEDLELGPQRCGSPGRCGVRWRTPARSDAALAACETAN